MKEKIRSRKGEEKRTEVPEDPETDPVKKKQQVSPAWTF